MCVKYGVEWAFCQEIHPLSYIAVIFWMFFMPSVRGNTSEIDAVAAHYRLIGSNTPRYHGYQNHSSSGLWKQITKIWLGAQGVGTIFFALYTM